MKEKLKKIALGYFPGFITGILFAGTISVIAATYFPSNQTTYDNSTSGLSSTNVQGAIDELYNVCKPKTGGDWVLDNVDIVTSGDGLYEDEYEDGKYTYKGANPNNYVTFNNEKASWRIISINSDGTIKIMRDASIGNRAWDTSGSNGNNNWNRPATLNTYLNDTYYNSLTSTAQSQIVSKDWSVGNVYYENTDLADQITNENSSKWNGKVALPTLSEYIRSNSDKEYCGTFKEINVNPGMCQFKTWMDSSSISSWWSLSPRTGISYEAYRLYSSGTIGGVGTQGTSAVRPTVTISSEVQITGGNGSKSNPYTLK